MTEDGRHETRCSSSGRVHCYEYFIYRGILADIVTLSFHQLSEYDRPACDLSHAIYVPIS
jgi:hypothetical protein